MVLQKKKIYSICMDEKIHGKLTRFVKKMKRKYKSFSSFLEDIGLAEIERDRKRRGNVPDD